MWFRSFGMLSNIGLGNENLQFHSQKSEEKEINESLDYEIGIRSKQAGNCALKEKAR